MALAMAMASALRSWRPTRKNQGAVLASGSKVRNDLGPPPPSKVPSESRYPPSPTNSRRSAIERAFDKANTGSPNRT
jgi:hypothetical protein